MKKTLISLLVGFGVGGIISFFFLDYQDKSYEIKNYYGEDKIVTEWDWDTISNAGTFIIVASILCYVIWVMIEKKLKRG